MTHFIVIVMLDNQKTYSIFTFQSIGEVGPASASGTKNSAVNGGPPAPIPAMPEVSSDHMCPILKHLDIIFTRAVRLAFPQYTAPIAVQIQVSRIADYQCNVAMALAKVT